MLERLRRRPGERRPRRHRRHLGGSRPGSDDRVGRPRWPRRSPPGAPARRWPPARPRPPPIAWRRWCGRATIVLVMGGGRSYVIAARLVSRSSASPPAITGRADPVPRLESGHVRPDPLVTRRTSSSASSAPGRSATWMRPWTASPRTQSCGPIPSHPPMRDQTAIRAWCNAVAASVVHAEADAERIWLAGDTVLVAFHGAWTTRASGDRTRIRGMLTLELDAHRRVSRARAWAADPGRGHRFDHRTDRRARRVAIRNREVAWLQTSPSTSSVSSIARSWSTPSTR